MKVQIENEFLSATFDTAGAELISLKSNNKEYIWEGNPVFWNKKSPVLFPTVGTLKDDTYFFEGKKYQLPRHGFAREKEFDIIEKTSSRIVFSLKEDAQTLKVYPFYFELQIEYLLIEHKLEVRYKVQNHSAGKMYFSIGGHPGFALEKNFDTYSLLFETEKELRFSVLENQLLADETQILETDNKKLELHYSLFEKDALVFKNSSIQSVVLQENGKGYLKVAFKDFPDLGIWTKLNAPFLCIEPWFGHADCLKTIQNLEEKEGIVRLDKEEVFQSLYTIEIL